MKNPVKVIQALIDEFTAVFKQNVFLPILFIIRIGKDLLMRDEGRKWLHSKAV